MRAFSLTLVLLFSTGCFTSTPEKCSASNCAGCCDATGACQPGTQTSACGASGLSCNTCFAPQVCSAGFCVNGNTGGGSGSTGGGSGTTGGGTASTCNATTCPDGCCDGDTCRGGTTLARCGAGGEACRTCGNDQTCTDGECSGGACNATSCPNGCCNAGVCVSGSSANACGARGQTCDVCTGAEQCDQGVCRAPSSCNATTCPTGCCNNGVCQAGGSSSSCGTAGATCDVCDATESCNGRSCVPATTSCDATTCPNGCCDGNSCVVNGGSPACGSGGSVCRTCASGQVCSFGQCEVSTCNAPTCPTGCCQGNVCMSGSGTSACGANGNQCSTCSAGQMCSNGSCTAPSCNATTCPTGCCDGNVCMPGSTTSSCGSGGGQCNACSSGQSCSNGRCVTPACDASTCSNGCCMNNTCVAPDAILCGLGGNQCVTCASGQSCNGSGQCTSGGSCNATTCPTGCCDGNVCLAGNTGMACGGNGNSCVSCGSGLSCVSGQCVAPTCNASTCPSGCCSGSVCLAGTSTNACGTGGNQCSACGSNQVCNGTACVSSCNASTCPSGCCQGSTCVSGNTTSTCGTGGNSCATCSSGQSCNNGSCSTGTQNGDACSNAPMVTLPFTGTQSLSGYANDFTSNTNGCKGSQGLDRMVRFQVPAGHRVTATVTPTVSTFDPMLSLVVGPASACVGSSATCVASSDTGSDNAAETASWFNTGTSAVDVFAIVDDYDTQSLNGAHTLNISSAPPPAGDTCATALSGSSGTAISRTVTDFTNDYASSSSCVSPSTGADFVVVYSVPANQSLTVVATPTSSVDVSINFSIGSAACTSRTCTTGVSKGTNGVTESLGWNNTTGATQSVYVTIDSTSSSTGSVTVTGTIGAALTCGPLTCGSGCCSGGVCQTGTANSACGTNGTACNTCNSPALCNSSQTCSASNLPTGAACTAASQCYEPLLGSAVCQTSWPGGYCSSTCFVTDQLCGGFGSSATGWCTANNQCLQMCNSPGSGQSNCRANYVCDTAAGTPSQGVCVPRCPTVACPSGSTCNAQGYCL